MVIIMIYYVAVNEKEKKIYLGKCQYIDTINRNIKANLKLKKEELLDWCVYVNGIYSCDNQPKEKVYRWFYDYFKEYIQKEGNYSFEIINKQPKVVNAFFMAIRDKMTPISKLSLGIMKVLS